MGALDIGIKNGCFESRLLHHYERREVDSAHFPSKGGTLNEKSCDSPLVESFAHTLQVVDTREKLPRLSKIKCD